MNEINNESQMPNPQTISAAPKSLPDASDLFRTAWNRYKQNWKSYIIIFLPLFVVAVILGIISSSVATDNPGAFSGLSLVVSLITVVVGFIAEIALIYAVINEDRQVTVGEAYQKGASLFWSFLLIQVIVGLIVFLGFIALILPGIYLGVRYSFSAFALVGEGKKGMDALNRSRDLVKGRWWDVFIRFLFVGIISLIPFILFFFINPSSLFGQILQNAISLAIAPLWILYVYGMYKSLKANVLPTA